MWLHKYLYCWLVPNDSCVAVFSLTAMVFVLHLFSCHLLASQREHSCTVFDPHLSKERSCKEQKFISLYLTCTSWRPAFFWVIHKSKLCISQRTLSAVIIKTNRSMKLLAFIVRTIQNTSIHCVTKLRIYVTAGRILYLLLAFKWLTMNVGLTLVRVFLSW